MEMPEVKKCCGLLPLRRGTLLISLFGLASGAVGVVGIILFGIAEDRILAEIMPKDQLNQDIKKVVLMTIGISSLMLLVANALLFIGVTTKARGAITAAYWVIFILCLLLISTAIAAPLSCFFNDSTCLVKKVSSVSITMYIIVLTVFIEVWLYFTTVAWNHEQELA